VTPARTHEGPASVAGPSSIDLPRVCLNAWLAANLAHMEDVMRECGSSADEISALRIAVRAYR